MKRLFASLTLLFILTSQFQVFQVYAQSEAELNAEKQKGTQVLGAVEQIVGTTVEKIDDKLWNNTKKKDQLEEKHEEIQEYLEEVEEEIQEENNSEDIKEKVETAKKVVVLKVVSWITEYEDVEDNINSEVADTPAEVEEALETIQDSMETESGDYSIIVRSTKTQTEVQSLFATFDTHTKIEEMYEADGKNYFEVFLAEDSLFREEMLEDIESWILPETFLWVEIVLPEVFGINVQSPSWEGDAWKAEGALDWETLSQTWGIEHYQSYNYITSQKQASQKIQVGVVDTGIDYNHPDLTKNVNQKLGKDFVNNDDDAWDDQGHGTHVAGTIAANVNGEWIIWVNPYVELIPLKICTQRGFCPSYAVLRALDYASTQKIDILNMSLGGRGNPKDHAICGAIASYTESWGIVVAASWNSNIDTSRFVPGWCAQAITVSAIDQDKERAAFSNYWSKVDVAAPGVQVYSTYPTNKGNYKKLSGTSMATPHIVGVISLMQSYDTDITTKEVKTALQRYTTPVTTDRSYKTIAKGVDLEKLMTSYQTPTTTPPVEKEEEIMEEKEVVVEKKEEIVEKKVTGSRIRYIRDWANGSNKNAWNFWVEIEATERGTGVNIAKGKDVSGSIPWKSSKPYTRITDGKIGTNSYFYSHPSTHSERSYVQVDLWASYDIEELTIYHYYTDGRTFNETKTEVSADGENWVVLHDSAVDGVYAEPKDGSGRSYKLGQQEKVAQTIVKEEVTKEPIQKETQKASQKEDTAEKEIQVPNDAILDPDLTWKADDDSSVEDKKDWEEESLEDAKEEVFVPLALWDPDSVEINSDESVELKTTDLESILVDPINDLTADQWRSYMYDENGDIIDDTVEINNADDGESVVWIELPADFDVEDMEAFKELSLNRSPSSEEEFQEEEEEIEVETVLIDGAEASIEINSTWDSAQELDIFTGSLDEFESQWPNDFDFSEQEAVEEFVETIEEIPEHEEELFIDGAETNVEINSLWEDEDEWEELEVWEYDPNAFLGDIIEWEAIIGYEDEPWVEINSLSEESSEDEEEILEIEQIIEEIEEIKESSELYLDGAESWVEINSVSEEDEEWEKFEISEYDPDEVFDDMIEWDPITIDGEEESTGIEINSSNDEEQENEESVEIEQVIEEIEFIEPEDFDEEIIIDGAEAWIEINSFSEDETEWELIEVWEYEENELPDSYIWEEIYADTPEDLLDLEDFQEEGTDEIEFDIEKLSEWDAGNAEEYDEESEDFQEEGSFGIQNTYYCNMKQKYEVCRIYLTSSNKYSYKTSNSEVSRHFAGSRYVMIQALEPGKATYKLSYRGRTYHTIYVNVEGQKAQKFSATVEEGKKTIVRFPKNDSSRYSLDEVDGKKNSRLYNYGSYVSLSGYRPGKDTYYISDRYGNTKYIIYLKVVSKPAMVKNISLIEGQTMIQPFSGTRNYSYSFSRSGTLSLTRYTSSLRIGALKAWNTKIFLKDRSGIHRYTFNIMVKAKPKPKEYFMNVVEWKTGKLYIPGKGSSYRVSYQGGQVIFRSSGNTIQVTGQRAGNLKLYFYENGSVLQSIVNIKVIPKPAETIKISLYEWQKVRNYLYRASSHSMSFSKSGYASLFSSSRYVYTEWRKAGKFKVYARLWGVHRYTLDITVKAKPKPKNYALNVHEGKTTKLYLPLRSSYRFYTNSGSTGSAYLRNYGRYGYITIAWFKGGKASYRIVDQEWLHRYTVNLNIIPKPPIKKSESLYAGKYLRIPAHGYLNPSVSRSWIVRAYRSWDSILLYALKAGKVNIYLKDAYGRHKYTYEITVKAIPKPKVQNISIRSGWSTHIHIPDNISNYHIRGSGTYIFDKKLEYTRSFYISTRTTGKYTITLRNKKTGFDAYVINIESKSEVRNISLYYTDAIPARYYGTSYTYKSKNSSVAVAERYRGRFSLIGNEIGTTQIHVYKKWGLREIWNVTVKSPPKVKTITCATSAGNECELRVPNGWYYTRTSISQWQFEVDGSSQKIEVESEHSWEIKIYVRSKIGNYITHVFVAKFSKPQVKQIDCITPVGIACKSYRIRNRNDYRIEVTESWIVRARSKRIWKNSSRTDKSELEILWLKPGVLDVYLYNGDDRVATIKTKVVPQVAPIDITGKSSIDVRVGETSPRIAFTGGNAKYSVEDNYYTDTEKYDGVVSASVNKTSETSGYITIKGVKEGRYSVRITDKWGLSDIIRWDVEAKHLILSEDEVTLAVGKSVVIHTEHVNGKIETLSRINTKVAVEKLSNTSFKITGLTPWVSTVWVRDSEGQYDSVVLTIKKSYTTSKESDTSKIRYIRDWADGSNKSSTNAWNEIKVFEKWTGKNLAKGITPTTDIHNPTWDLRSLTDEVIQSGYSSKYWTGKSSANELNYMQIDLWDLYEIEKVWVWRFFTDGRTFKNTKTEVSADWINWTILHDSAVDGTYAEPKDGSGRSYKVEQTEQTPTSKDSIRYIRDWLSGSNRNTWNHWIEIQALDANGNNKAKWKKITATGTPWSTRPLSRITDGSLTWHLYTGFYGKDQSVTVDLWKSYDIEKVKIWHYYPDGRTYNNTKTEVSVDGKTWTTLYDSAVSGTYAEPKDGSGREYEVNGSSLNVSEWFKKVEYQSAQTEEWLNTVDFTVEGNPKEVWIYWLKWWITYKQVLDKDDSWEYLLACDNCPEKSLPYVITKLWDKKYASPTFISTDSDVTLSSFSESWVEINNIDELDFQTGDWYYHFGKNKGFLSIQEWYLKWVAWAAQGYTEFQNLELSQVQIGELKKLVLGQHTMQAQINQVPEYSELWIKINNDIAGGAYVYSKENRQRVKGYLAASAIIGKSTNWETSKAIITRVVGKWNTFHGKQIWNGLKISSYDFSSTIEEGYIWGMYFEVNNNVMVQEAGFEYYHSTNWVTPIDSLWTKEVFQKNWDGEYATFVLPKNKNTLIRWYVIWTEWLKRYTKISGHTMQYEGEETLQDLYPWQRVSSVEDEWVEINVAPVAVYFGVVALVNAWLKVHDWYTTIQDCNSDGLLSLNCTLGLWLSLIPVGWTGKVKNVLGFAGEAKDNGKNVIKYTSPPNWKDIPWVKWSSVTKPNVSNTKLKSIVEEMYRWNAKIWNGSTADALRYEKKTGILLSESWHQQKVVDRRRELKNWLKKNYDASKSDIKSANDMLDDLNQAFNAKY